MPIFVALIAYPWWVHHQLDLILSLAAKQLRGAKTLAILCDGPTHAIRSSCELVRNSKDLEPIKICAACVSSKLSKCESYFDDFIYLSCLVNEFTNIAPYSILCEEDLRSAISPLLTESRVCTVRELLCQHSNAKSAIITDIINSVTAFAQSRAAAANFLNTFVPDGDVNKGVVFSLFNGRFHPYSGFLGCFIKHTSSIQILHERGSISGSFRICVDHLPFDTPRLLKQFSAYRPNTDEMSELKRFLMRRITHGQENFLQFIGTKAYSSSAYGDTKNIVTFFTSSSDEIVLIDSDFSFYQQLKALRLLASKCHDEGYHLRVKHHPNLGCIGSPRSALEFLADIDVLSDKIGFEIIGPDNSRDWLSFALESSLCVTVHSSLYIDMRLLALPAIALHSSQLEPVKDSIDFEFFSNTIQQTISSLEIIKRERALSIGGAAAGLYLWTSITSKLVSIKNVYHENLIDAYHASVDLFKSDSTGNIIERIYNSLENRKTLSGFLDVRYL